MIFSSTLKDFYEKDKNTNSKWAFLNARDGATSVQLSKIIEGATSATPYVRTLRHLSEFQNIFWNSIFVPLIH